MNIVVGPVPVRRRSAAPYLIGGILGVLTLLVVIAWCSVYLPGYLAYSRYQPQEGDLVFQSLPFSRVVTAIEGATHSPLSHCGIVARENGQWVVYEAYKPVEAISLRSFVSRGRNESFEVYRFRAEEQRHIASILSNVRGWKGRPYDERYRLDDNAEAIYCSELIYLAYQQATGKPLGQLVTLGELKWQPYLELIEQIEKGPPPLDRQIITPRDLAAAPQLERVYSYGYGY